MGRGKRNIFFFSTDIQLSKPILIFAENRRHSYSRQLSLQPISANQMKKSYHSYWAKTQKTLEGEPLKYHLLPYHLLDVAAVAWVLLERDTRLCSRLAQMAGMDSHSFRVWFTFLMGLHDVGKFSQTFQHLQESVVETINPNLPKKGNYSSTRHDSLGYLIWKDELRPYIESLNDGNLKAIFEQIRKQHYHDEDLSVWLEPIMGHHGKPPVEQKPNGDNISKKEYFDPETIVSSKEFTNDWFEYLSGQTTGSLTFHTPYIEKPASWNIAGLAVLCDWIGSSEHFSYCAEPMEISEYWNTIALPQAENAISTFSVVSSPVNINTLNCKTLFGFVPSPLQEWAEKYVPTDNPELVLIEDVTGAGKTEATIIVANRLLSNGNADGVFFALPTMATANAMYKRLAKQYKKLFADNSKPSLVLAHGSASLNDDFQSTILDFSKTRNDDYSSNEMSISAECNAWFSNSSKKAMLADIGVGTIDQVLLSVLQVKHQSLRLIGMTRKILIVDEVHASDAYMFKILQRVLYFQAALGGSAILLSATLPHAMRQKLVKEFAKGLKVRNPNLKLNSGIGTDSLYPLTTVLNNEGIKEQHCATRSDVERAIRIEFRHSQDEILHLVEEQVKNGKCVCWVRNTVSDAIEGQNLLKLKNIAATLFHARFAMCDRLNSENFILEHFGKTSTASLRKGRVVVATQVIEQSLDVDFDILVSDLVPIDSLIQRFGRTRRHRRDEIGNPLQDEKADMRGETIGYILSPEIDGEISSNWYSSLFKRGAKVYQNHVELYLTAAILNDKKTIVMPDDARFLIESVFGEEVEVPERAKLLQKFADVKMGKDSAARSAAMNNMLWMEKGYTKTDSNWLDDTIIPTRLGEPTITLRLAKYNNKEIHPWALSTVQHPWEMSEVRIMATYISSEKPFEDMVAFEKAKLTMRDNGKYVVTIVLEENNGIWQGAALNDKNEVVIVTYDSSIGLQVGVSSKNNNEN